MIEVERLISEGNDLLRTMQEHGVELKHEQLPISALVRCPLIAFRWQLPDKKVCRVLVMHDMNLHVCRFGGSSSSSRPAATMILPTTISSSSACE
jgi:hypothetical protein